MPEVSEILDILMDKNNLSGTSKMAQRIKVLA